MVIIRTTKKLILLFYEPLTVDTCIVRLDVNIKMNINKQ